MKSHNLEHKSQKRKRNFRRADSVAEGDTNAVKKLLGLK
jgi:ribosomal protein L35